MHHTNSSSDPIHKTLTPVRSLAYRRSRDAAGHFLIEGVRQFVQAWDAQFEFDTLIHSKILLQQGLAQKLVRKLTARGVRHVSVTPEQFRSISRAPRASGIAAIVKQRWFHLHEVNPHPAMGWLVIEHLNAAGNLGTILRTAEATGMAGVIFVGTSCDPYDPAVVRASMGGIFHLTLVRASSDSLGRRLTGHHIQGVALSPGAPRFWTDLPRDVPLAIMLGEERHGLSDSLKKLCGMSVRLPMTGHADSLNVGVAAGVMMYELMRRRMDLDPVCDCPTSQS
jgi:TrmH family RNA methyltransferase